MHIYIYVLFIYQTGESTSVKRLRKTHQFHWWGVSEKNETTTKRETADSWV